MTVAIVAMITLSSCGKDKEEPTGVWEKMQWEQVSYTTVKYDGASYYKVPKEGGTYTFRCMNYPGFWLSNVLVVDLGDGSNKKTYYYPQEDDPKKLECAAAKVIVADQQVTITIAPLSECSSRIISLSVTAGNIFDDFSFIQ